MAVDENLQKIRHSLAHVMAEAVLRLIPETKVAIGRTTVDGEVVESALTLTSLGVQLFDVDTDNLRSFQLLQLYGNLYWLNLPNGSNALQFVTQGFREQNQYSVEIQTRYIIEAGGF